MAKIIIFLANGFEEIEAVNIIDVCRRAGIEVVVAGVSSMLVCGANKITIAADCLLESVKDDDFDMVVLPGGWGGTKILATDEIVQNMLKKFKQEDKWIGAICTAPFALHQADVLNSNYTCYPSVQEQIRVAGYDAKSKVVVDGKVITSRGPATAICFGLVIVKKLVGREIADMVRGGLLADFC